MSNILVVDDELNIRTVLKGLLKKNGYLKVSEAGDGNEALELIDEHHFDLIISDLNMPHMDGMTLFKKVRHFNIPFVILTAFGSIEKAVEAVKNGVFDFIPKPFDEDNLIQTTKKALSLSKNASREVQSNINQIFFDTKNPKLCKIKYSLEQVVKSKANLLITGESGTGKGVLANIIHQASEQRDNPFIKVNCAAIPENLLESELFGYVKGAFTGAVQNKPGKFELADKGTLFLDEIGEMPLVLQTKLLSAIQDREITRVGDNKVTKVDLRLITATNCELRESVKNNDFREDLYYRINVIEFHLPPLRDRPDDIINLINFFNKKYSKEYSVPEKIFSPDSIESLTRHSWNGNIRELENFIQKILILEKDEEITKGLLQDYLTLVHSAQDNNLFTSANHPKQQKEISLIKNALSEAGGNRTKAAKILGISRRTLLYRIKEYGINE